MISIWRCVIIVGQRERLRRCGFGCVMFMGGDLNGQC